MHRMGEFLVAKTYRIDQHPKRNAIIKALINQTPYQTVADEYGLSYGSVQRYVSQKLRYTAAMAVKEGNYDGAALLSRIEETIVYVQRMYEACDEWLRDPEDSTRYNLDARASEIEVTYDEYWEDSEGNQRKRRKKSRLQYLLNQADVMAEDIIMVESKHADPRSLILDTARTLNRQLETLAKIAGVVKDVTQIDVNISQHTSVITNIIAVIEREVQDREIMERIVEGLTSVAE